MRGKVFLAPLVLSVFRITPAYAGKRSSQRNIFKFFWDHPRLCGEKVIINDEMELEAGSPPPMRGKECPHSLPAVGGRITPAYAGKRLDRSPAHSQTRDHPRLCGEKTKKILKQRYFFHQPASFSFSLQYT